MTQTVKDYEDVGLELWEGQVNFSFSMSLGEWRNVSLPCTHALISQSVSV